MRKMSLRLLCEAVSKKRKGGYGTVRIGVVLPTTHGTHGATWLSVHVLGKGPVSSLELSTTDTTLHGVTHGLLLPIITLGTHWPVREVMQSVRE